ncbi:hypothetical protein EYF80_036369 [Liparis tanakae]|uniref:Uncharacterized protein n=1 Tax=Liparis tanakae TaxID=230148 RepID=A0A4Z2GL09_9TELE|nr:hypothetical protein EYF80_036369 [Liparis tanakae]
MLRMTQLCSVTPPHSTCRLGEVMLASWKLFRLRTPHANTWRRGREDREDREDGEDAVKKSQARCETNRFDSLRNHEDVGFPLGGRGGEVRLLRLPIGTQDGGGSSKGDKATTKMNVTLRHELHHHVGRSGNRGLEVAEDLHLVEDERLVPRGVQGVTHRHRFLGLVEEGHDGVGV